MRRASHWRKHALDVIGEVVHEYGTDDLEALEKAIRAAYPFGERAMWPYKVWLKAVNDTMKQLGKRTGNEEDYTALPLFGGNHET